MATILTQSDPSRPASAGYKVDISRGQRIGRVSSEWFSRPDDERFLSLSSLHAAMKARAERATTRTFETRDVKVEASRDDAERLALLVPGRDGPVMPPHWSFGQLCSLVGAPSGYLRQLPAPLAGINMQHSLLSHRAELMKTLETDDGRIELRAVERPSAPQCAASTTIATEIATGDRETNFSREFSILLAGPRDYRPKKRPHSAGLPRIGRQGRP